MRSLLFLGVVATLLAACETAPVTGRSQMMLVGKSEERQMGLQAHREVLSKEQPSEDAKTNAVAQVGTTAAAVALSAIVTGRSRAYLPAMMAALGAGATVGYLLPMSRAQESEADRIGPILMALAGYDPREAVTVWERMRAANTAPRKAEWLSTHPADTTRIADIRHWLPEAMKYYRPQ